VVRHLRAASSVVLAIVALAGSLLAPAAAVAQAPVAPPPPQPAVTQPQPAFLGGGATRTQAVTPAATTLAAGFSDVTVFTGLTEPSKIQFAADGRVFVAEKGGLILVYSSLSATTPTVYADLRSEVDDYWDRGLLGFTLSPNFVTDHTFYVQYAYDHNPVSDYNGNSYHAPTQWNDACPTPPGPTTDGCTILGRISKFSAVPGPTTPLGPANETTLVQGWCQQYPSHSNDDLWIGPDGLLYSTAGDGASFDGPDYGQLGGTTNPLVTPANPCADPPTAIGTAQTIPTAEGGALRAQSVRRVQGMSTAVLNGALLRIDPSTGYGVASNPFFTGNGNNNQSRILAFGLRNPFRFTFQPNKSTVWIGDVGDGTWEEIDKLPMAATASNDDFGWPCNEGAGAHPGWPTGITACTTLTNAVGPYYTYNHSNLIANEANCPTANGSSISGMAFYTGTAYPASYQGALFFGDHTRSCIWAMLPDASGNPNPSNIKVIVDGGAQPVDIETGPNGDLFYVRYDAGEVHRLTYGSPQAVIKADKTSGPAPLTVNFDGSTSSSPIGATPLTYSWSFSGGSCSSTTAAKPSCTFAAGTYQVRLTVKDTNGASNTSPVTTITAGSSPPTAFIDAIDGAAAPAQPTLDGSGNPPAVRPASVPAFYTVGDTITFAGHATDPQAGTLPAADLTWNVRIFHCPSACHTHDVQTIVGSGGSVPAPDHPYPSLLWIQLTATNAQGLSSSASVYLYPKTSTFTLNTVPAGLTLGAGTTTGTGPYQATFLLGGNVTLSAPSPQALGANVYTFSGWSDGGAASHGVTASTASATYTATYTKTGAVTYLSDLTPTYAVNGWGPYEKDMSNGEQAAGDGHPITIRGVTYAKGLGVHAVSDLRYTLPANCTSYNAIAGIDDETAGRGSVDFQVYLDGGASPVYDSGVVTGTSAAQDVAVDVTGHTQLRLVVAVGTTMDYDHSDWADAKLTCSTAADTTPPTVTGTVPASGATGVATGTTVKATFSEALAPASVSTTTVQLIKQGTTTTLPATVTYDSTAHSATLVPTAALAASTAYTASLMGGSGGITDVAGNALAATFTWSFTTAATTQTTTYLSDLTPTYATSGWGPYEKDRSNGEQAAGDGKPITLAGVVYAKGLGVHAAADLRYNLGGLCSTFTASVGVDDEVGSNGSVDFQVYLDGAATATYDSGTLTGTSATKAVAVTVTGTSELRLVVTDAGDGNSYDHADWADAKVVCSPATDTTPPTVTATSPTSGATGVSTASPVTATFSEALNAATLTSATFRLVPQGSSTAVAATITYAAATHVATLTPTASLVKSTTYTATLLGGGGGVADLSGNTLVSNVAWSFTTATGVSHYLSDLTPTSAVSGWGPYERDMSNGEQNAGDGKPITLNGVVYPKGLGMHAAADLKYALGGTCSAFSASVGVDDEVGTKGSVIFQVFLDGTKVYDSGVMTGATATNNIALSLGTAATLELVVTDGGDGIDSDHADWAAAQITCSS